MKRFLLERCPMVWNTGVVWAVPLALLAHVVYFVWGYNQFEIDELWVWYSFGHYLSKQAVVLLLNVVITVLLLLVWVLHLLRHNAFKAFYPFGKRRLIGQFVSYYVVIFLSGAMIISFIWGMKVKMDTYTEDIGITQYIEYFYHSVHSELREITLGYLYLALVGAMLLLCFRLTDLRTTLFTVIVAAIGALVLGLLEALVYDNKESLTAKTFGVLYALAAIGLFFTKRMSKLAKGILMNLILLFFPLAVFFILLEINQYIGELLFEKFERGELLEDSPAFSHWVMVMDSLDTLSEIGGLVLIVPFLVLYAKKVFNN